MMKNTFRNARLYAFCLMVALTMFGCGLEEDNPPAGGTSLTGDASNGKSLYVSKGCSGCHGVDATGGIGPDIQGDLADHIESMAGTGQMAFVSVTDQEAADISAYLATIESADSDTGGADTDTGDADTGGDADAGAGDADTGGDADADTGDADTGGDDADTGDGDGVIPVEDGDPVNGAQLFIDNGCFGCHGADATGGIGPNITQDTVEKVTNFVGVVPPMTGISLSPQDRADIVAWLNSL